MSEKNELGFNTRAIHDGWEPSPGKPSLVVPIDQSVGYVFLDTAHAAALFEGTEEGFIYGRINNITVDAFERKMASLEGAESALATSSGMAAIATVAMYLAKGGDVVSSDRLYGGTFHLFQETLPEFGIKVRFPKNPHHIKDWESEITEKTKLLFVETPSNPKVELFDIGELAELAHKHSIPLVVDSTIATPALQQPISLGADVVVHSATKYIGIGRALGGVIAGAKDLMTGIRFSTFRDIGPSLSPANASLFLGGLETLSLRMKEHSKNARKVASALRKHPNVKKVYYPGSSELVRRQMSGYASSLMAFEIKGGRKQGSAFVESLQLVSHVANLGDSRSLAIHPASTTHYQLPEEDLKRIGISEGLVRLSIGIEDPTDIIADIIQALDRSVIQE